MLGSQTCHRLKLSFVGNAKVNELKRAWVEEGELHDDAKPGCSRSLVWAL